MKKISEELLEKLCRCEDAYITGDLHVEFLQEERVTIKQALSAFLLRLLKIDTAMVVYAKIVKNGMVVADFPPQRIRPDNIITINGFKIKQKISIVD